MSVVVWDGKTLAADQAMWMNNIKYRVNKIHKVKTTNGETSFLVGGVGNSQFVKRGIDFLMSAGIVPKPDYKEYHDVKMDDYYFILVDQHKRIYFYDASFTSIEILDPFTAIGAGTEVAIGALEAGADAKTAVEICMKRTDSAGIDISTVSFDD